MIRKQRYRNFLQKIIMVVVQDMIKSEIEALKRELNCRINEGADFNDVYELSVKLDKLILQYYKERGINRQLI